MATVAFLMVGASDVARAQYTSGDVYWASLSSPYDIYNVTGGGDVSGTVFTQGSDYNAGQLAWSLDLSTMYLTQFSLGTVLAITSSGAVSTFATGLDGPTGIVMTTDGVLLVAEYGDGDIIDITTGGDFASAAALTTGLSGPRNLVELSDGRVLVADQDLNAVLDINYPGGGAASSFATGLSTVRTLAQDAAGVIYACYTGNVFDITAGGDFSSAATFANGPGLYSLAVDANGNLLSAANSGTVIYNITAGGDFSSATPWATGLFGGSFRAVGPPGGNTGGPPRGVWPAAKRPVLMGEIPPLVARLRRLLGRNDRTEPQQGVGPCRLFAWIPVIPSETRDLSVRNQFQPQLRFEGNQFQVGPAGPLNRWRNHRW